MLEEVKENKKICNEVELDKEIVKLKQKHSREPGMEENPPSPNKKQKRWHCLKEKKKKRIKAESLALNKAVCTYHL